MQLKKLQHYLELYRDFLPDARARERLYAWESQRIFQEHWQLDAADFAEMYDRSLDNSQTRRLWKRENYEPKRMMLVLATLTPELARQAFWDLYCEEKDIEARADRFVFYCDELLRTYKEANPRSVENNHYHNDQYAMASLYLAFRYPNRYTLYDHAAFRRTLQLLGSADVPQIADFGRFCKVTRTWYSFLQKDSALLARHRARLDARWHYTGESLLLVWDFYQFCAETTLA